MLRAGTGAIKKRFAPSIWADPDVVPYAAKVSGVGALVRLARHHVPVRLPAGVLVSRQRRVHAPAGSDVGSQWTGPLPAPDERAGHVALAAPPQRLGLCFDHGRHRLQAGVASPLGLQSAIYGFLFLVYYPALALLAVVFTSLWFGLAWTTMTAVVYALICLTVGPGLNFDEDHEKLLLVRVRRCTS